MITDEQLRTLIEHAGASIQVPEAGPASVSERVLGAASHDLGPAVRHDGARPVHHLRRRAVTIGSIGAIAACGLVLALVLPGALDRSGTGGTASVRGGASVEPSSAASSKSIAPAVPTELGVAGGTAVGAPSTPSVARSSASASASGPLISSTGSLSLTVGRGVLRSDVGRLATVATSAGGYVASSTLDATGSRPYATVTISVPATRFEAAIRAAEALGTTRSLTTAADNVTGQVDDTTAQVQALEDVRSQLEVLLGRAAKVSDLLSVEQQIESVEVQIDELQSTERTLDHEVADAKLSIALAVPATTKPAPHHRGALATAWSKAVSSFLHGLWWLLAASGAVVFGVLCAGAVLVLARFGRRRIWPVLRRYLL